MRLLSDRDIQMFCIMESMKELSLCIDKQVVCLIVGQDGGIRSVGINTVLDCDKNCHDKEHRICNVKHAERVAIDCLKDKSEKGLTAYVSLFPCKACQEAIDPYVDQIITFGMAHKEWVSDKVLVYAHPYYSLEGPQPFRFPKNKYAAIAVSQYTDYKEIALIQSEDASAYSQFKQERAYVYRDLLEQHTERGVKPYTITTYNHKKP